MDWQHIISILFSSGAVVGAIKTYINLNNKVITLEERISNEIRLLEKIETKIEEIVKGEYDQE
jgi:hypothetical protein